MWSVGTFLFDGFRNGFFHFKIIKPVPHSLLLIPILHKPEGVYPDPGCLEEFIAFFSLQYATTVSEDACAIRCGN